MYLLSTWFLLAANQPSGLTRGSESIAKVIRRFFPGLRRWNYVLVRAYLNDKPELEHTGQETYIHELQRGGLDGIAEVSYFPIGEAGVLQNANRRHGGVQ